MKTKSYRVGTNYDRIKGRKVGKEGVAVKTYQLELYRKSFENRALQLFKETFLQLIEDLDLEQLYDDLNQLIQDEVLPNAHYRIMDREGHPSVRIGELDGNYGNLELKPLEGSHKNSNNKDQLFNLRTIVVRDNIRLTSLIVTFNRSVNYLSVEHWLVSGNEQFLKWDGEVFEVESKEYSYLLWLFATIGDYFYDFEEEV